jgi:hypothetical protein
MGHYLSQQSTPLHFGLGTLAQIKTVVITWPSGIVQTMRNVAADQLLVVTETQ